MDDKGTMTATFEPTLDVWKLIDGKPTEYVVVNPVIVEARLRPGEVKRYPQEIRERVVRCRDCEFCLVDDHDGICCMRVWDPTTEDCQPVEPEGFCSWGKERGA